MRQWPSGGRRRSRALSDCEAGIEKRELAAFMATAPIAVTFDLYRHVFPCTEIEAAATLLGNYLDRAFVTG
jgi:hypothetical protein